MKWFYNWKIKWKLIAAFVFIALAAATVGMVATAFIYQISTANNEMYERHTVTMRELADIARDYQRQRVALRDLYIDKDASTREEHINEMKELDIQLSNSLNKFEDSIRDDAVRKEYDKLLQGVHAFREIRDEIIEHIQANRMDQAHDLFTGGYAHELVAGIQEATDRIFALHTGQAQKSAQINASRANIATIIMLGIIVSTIMVAIGVGIFNARIISKPIHEMVEVAEKLAANDLNVHIETDTGDEIGILARAFRKMADNLNEFMTGVQNASEQVAAGAVQVSDASIALSEGATEQASSIEELTASLEEISSQTRLNAQHADQANELAENAKMNATQGNVRMQEMLQAMDEINVSSGNIYKIIRVIDDIAFQTNILALNAGVEAARAGQQGKGFAVVAEEVRTLAARSANAAKETAELIESSIKKVEDGTRIAKETAEDLNKVVEEVEKVAGLVNDIAAASNEQATGIEQINQGIVQVSEVVQTNSATSEEGAAASEELSSQAALLKEMVSRFKLKKNDSSRMELPEITPEVLKMLEKISENNNKEVVISREEDMREPVAVGAGRIALSDEEFGKYSI
ncbi:MAG: methyl-accepting chemotaxis protein [Clostridia bacterium]|jgi:methyl-accepting chemotaxis protein